LTRALRATLISVGLLALSSSPAAAATADPAAPDGAAGSLRQLIAAANPSDTTIQLPPGTYRLTQGQLAINKTLTLQGLGQQAGQVVITAEGRGRVLLANPPAATTVLLNRLQVTGGVVVGATGGGILKQGAGSLNLVDVALAGNSASGSQGGGGLASEAGGVSIVRSAVFDNSASVSVANGGGGGILHTGPNTLTLDNTSLAQNKVTVSGSPSGTGGSAVLNTSGALNLDFVTIGYNTTSPGGLGALRSNGAIAPTLRRSILSNNGANCIGAINSNDFNIVDDGGCDLDQPGDKPSVAAAIQAIADNGGPTPTLRLPPESVAINAAGTCSASRDQRFLVRPAENETLCDAGAVEFEGWAKVDVPPCSRSGDLPFRIFSPPETGVEALDYTIDNGDTLNPIRALVSGGSSATGTINIPEGRRRLEYWADSFPTGIDKGVQIKHATPLAVVDRTDPRVGITNPNDFRVFVIKRRTNVDVAATDSISGLVTDPSGRRPLDTSQRGSKTFAPEAVDLCANAAMAPFSYRVLAPGLGVRTVLERVRGTVLTRPAAGGGSARESQKGRSFAAFREPREVAVRSLVDTRKGTVRVTSSRDTRTGIQDGEFAGGVVQVRQSRKRSAKGLTELRLTGSSFRSCSSRSGRRASTAAGRVIRRLRGSGRGRFRTRGRYSAATVRGTKWTVEDRCDGTLTRVTQGTVAVRDFRRRRTITVRAGKSYLARAPG